MQPCTILYAEDEENDVFLIKRALRVSGLPHTLAVVPDGMQAIDYLAGDGPFADRALHPLPALILLDIKMPKRSGLEVLEWIRQQPGIKSLPVVMFTSSSRPEDQEKAHLFGANEYVLKPSSPRAFIDLVKSFHDRWLSKPPISRSSRRSIQSSRN